MGNVLMIKTLEELNQFLNENGILEIAIRNRNKRFKDFQKVVLGENLFQDQSLAKQAINVLNRQTHLNSQMLAQLGSVAKIGQAGLLMNGLNLCATCAGFAIMYAKLDEMSAQITSQLEKMQKAMRKGRDAANEYEYNKVLSDHMDMLDSERRQQPYPEAKLRELVDREHSVLTLLVRTLQSDIAEDVEGLIFSIFSLLSMFTVSLRKFDEIYYYNNHETLGSQNAWHLSHDRWMKIYETLSAPWVAEKLQDFGFIEKDLSVEATDVYWTSLMEQVEDCHETVIDNQLIVSTMGNEDMYRKYQEMTEKDVVDSIRSAFKEAGRGMDDAEVECACDEALKAAAVA